MEDKDGIIKRAFENREEARKYRNPRKPGKQGPKKDYLSYADHVKAALKKDPKRTGMRQEDSIFAKVILDEKEG